MRLVLVKKYQFRFTFYTWGIAAQSFAWCHVKIPLEIDENFGDRSRDNPKTFPKQNPSTKPNRSKPHKPTPSSSVHVQHLVSQKHRDNKINKDFRKNQNWVLRKNVHFSLGIEKFVQILLFKKVRCTKKRTYWNIKFNGSIKPVNGRCPKRETFLTGRSRFEHIQFDGVWYGSFGDKLCY